MKRFTIVALVALSSTIANATDVICVTAANRMNSCIDPKAVSVDSTGKLRAARLYMGADEITATSMRTIVHCAGETPVQSWVRNSQGVNLAGANAGDMTSDARTLGKAICSAKSPKLDAKLKP